jgi:hypothetical protein
MAWNAEPPGWRPGGERLTCVLGNGAHCKPRIAETQGFGGPRFRHLVRQFVEVFGAVGGIFVRLEGGVA